MLKKLFSLLTFSFLFASGYLSAEIEYDIHDIDTLQTHSSEAIALNNEGQILGWYNIDGSKDGKHFFVRDRNGDFHEISNRENENEVEINWRYLTDNGNTYGTYDGNTNFSVLYMWDQKNGVIKLGNLPGKEISAINNSGQVLIKSVKETENGITITRPVIWHNGQITKLKGLEGDLGIESLESYGFDMNNKGEVVGQSLTSLVYKNNVYYQIHAVKWVGDQAIDLHNTVPKQEKTSAVAINDAGNILINYNHDTKLNNSNYTIHGGVRRCTFKDEVLMSNIVLLSTTTVNQKLQKDYESPWFPGVKFISINNNGEIIAKGKTIYGESHAMLLTISKTP